MRLVVYFRATRRTFQPKVEKIKQNPPRKIFLIFQEMEPLCSHIKTNSGNGNPL